MNGKRDGQFDRRLVKASATLIRDRWAPDPEPKWLTYVPSKRHPELVPQFARQLADQLGIPCKDVVGIVKGNQPQKRMENAHHRCFNLDGVFEIRGEVSTDPVLLVDDTFDSGWTFAVIAALLRQAGAGLVFPFAIMSASASN